MPTPADDATMRVQRQTMVDCQIRTFDVTDRRVLDRFFDVPREHFVPDERRALAYSDVGLVIEAAATAGEPRYILPPMILARMIQGGHVKAGDRVLDVAGGYGYSAAILAGLGGTIVALESSVEFAQEMRTRLSGLGLSEVEVHHGDLAAGLPDEPPFDVILVNGCIETNSEALLDRLNEGGRLLTIQGGPSAREGRAAKAVCIEMRNGGAGTRYLFDASAPTLRAFRAAPQFVF